MSDLPHVRIVKGVIEIDGQSVPTFSWTLRSDDLFDAGVPHLEASIPVISFPDEASTDLTFEGDVRLTYIVSMNEWIEGRGSTVIDALEDLIVQIKDRNLLAARRD